MHESLRAQIETYLPHLESLIQRGYQVRDALATDPSNKSAIAAATRVWQEECGERSTNCQEAAKPIGLPTRLD